jgi:hypothetical protein
MDLNTCLKIHADARCKNCLGRGVMFLVGTDKEKMATPLKCSCAKKRLLRKGQDKANCTLHVMTLTDGRLCGGCEHLIEGKYERFATPDPS